MKYLLLVHHDEAAFDDLGKEKQRLMLAESVQLTHQLHAKGQYLSASPLQPAATAAIVNSSNSEAADFIIGFSFTIFP